MKKPIRDLVLEKHIFQSRMAWAMFMVLLAFLVLAGRFYFLQIAQYDLYSNQSEANRVRLYPSAPNRGLILDRNGEILATNEPAYRLEILPEQVKNLDQLLDKLSKVVSITERDINRFYKLKKLKRSFHSIPIRYRLDENELARFFINRHQFPGVDAAPYLSRYYPKGEAFSHVLGYVGQMDANDLLKYDEKRYRATTQVGKTGLEAYYESLLHGEPGFEKVETNVQGRVLKVLDQNNPIHGQNLWLALHSGIQEKAYEALGNHIGAVVAMKAGTGEVLALVSKPAYDNNDFVTGLSHLQYQTLLQSRGRPLFNRAIQGGYEPGSTIKPFIALAGLDAQIIQADTRVFSNGMYQIPGRSRVYRDWKKGGHGSVDLEQALAQSVNVYFYQLALKLGINQIHERLSPFGFGQKTGLDLNGELSGLLPSAKWKRTYQQQPWYEGETVIVGIGQGPFVVTPIQLAWATNKIASGHSIAAPHLKRSSPTPDAETENTPDALSEIKPEHWDAVRKGMQAVIHHPLGSAHTLSKNLSFKMAGKTGTAQVFGHKEDATDEERTSEVLTENLKHHALFIAYAPADQPLISVAVVVEHGGGGSRVAAPVAKEILEYALKVMDP